MNSGWLSSHSHIGHLNVYHGVKLIKPVEVKFPRHASSVVVVPPKERVYVTPDKTTCEDSPCFPKDSPYRNPPKLKQCQHSPSTLYELAADVVDREPLPEAIRWTVQDVVKWMGEEIGLPQYKNCILENHIDGMRLLRFEDSSELPNINIHSFDHIKKIVDGIHKLYSVEFFSFTRSVGLPHRKPLTHCKLFKSRTGPSWGIRQNWTRCDLLRWMKILGPAPVHRDHWDLVWYEKPEFPKTLFGSVKGAEGSEKIPRYDSREGMLKATNEYLVPRKFYLNPNEADEVLIWMEQRPNCPFPPGPVTQEQVLRYFAGDTDFKRKTTIRKSLMPRKINLKGLTGDNLLLARRLRPTPKFFKK